MRRSSLLFVLLAAALSGCAPVDEDDDTPPPPDVSPPEGTWEVDADAWEVTANNCALSEDPEHLPHPVVIRDVGVDGFTLELVLDGGADRRIHACAPPERRFDCDTWEGTQEPDGFDVVIEGTQDVSGTWVDQPNEAVLTLTMRLLGTCVGAADECARFDAATGREYPCAFDARLEARLPR